MPCSFIDDDYYDNRGILADPYQKLRKRNTPRRLYERHSKQLKYTPIPSSPPYESYESYVPPTHKPIYDTTPIYTPLPSPPPSYTNHASIFSNTNNFDANIYNNMFKGLWEHFNREDDVKEQLKEIGYDLLYNTVPSQEFLDILKSEKPLPDEFEPIVMLNCVPEDYLDENQIKIEITKSETQQISYNINYQLHEQYSKFLDDMEKDIKQNEKEEVKYQQYLTEKREKELLDKQGYENIIQDKPVVSKPLIEPSNMLIETSDEIDSKTSLLLSDSVNISTLPLGYSSVNIDVSDYDIVSPKISFNEEVTCYNYKTENETSSGSGSLFTMPSIFNWISAN